MGAGVAVEVDVVIVGRIWKIQSRGRLAAAVLTQAQCRKQRQNGKRTNHAHDEGTVDTNLSKSCFKSKVKALYLV